MSNYSYKEKGETFGLHLNLGKKMQAMYPER